MATSSLTLSSIVSNTGWTNPLDADTSNDIYASAVTAGSAFVAEIDDVAGDFGSANTIVLGVEWSFATTASRVKNLLIELVDAAGTVLLAADGTTLLSFATPTFTDLTVDTIHQSGAFDVSHMSAAQLNAARLRVTMQEGGGMADSVDVQLDHAFVTLDYNAAVAETIAAGFAEATVTGFAATLSEGSAPPPAGVVAQDSTISAIHTYHKKTFAAAGRRWAFYMRHTGAGNPTLSFSSSNDGVNWTAPTDVREIQDDGRTFGTYFDGTHVHYAYVDSIADDLFYRRGAPQSDGTITWDPERTVLSSALNISVPAVAVLDSGKVAISYDENNGDGTHTPVLLISTAADGTWTTETTETISGAITTASAIRTNLLPLTGGGLYAIYSYEGASAVNVVNGRLWDGAAWDAAGPDLDLFPNSSSGAGDEFNNEDHLTDGTGVHLALYDQGATDAVLYRARTGGSWGSIETVKLLDTVVNGQNDKVAMTLVSGVPVVYFQDVDEIIKYRTRQGVDQWSADTTVVDTATTEFAAYLLVADEEATNESLLLYGNGTGRLRAEVVTVNTAAADTLVAGFTEAPVSGFTASLTAGARTLAATFATVAVTAFPASLSPGANTLAAAFDEAAVSSFSATLTPGARTLAVTFSSVTVDGFTATLTEGSAGATIAAGFDEVAVTSFPATLTPGARTIAAAFDEAAVIGFAPSFYELGAWSAPTSITVGANADTIAASFDEINVASFAATLTAAEMLVADFDAVTVTSFAAALTPGARTLVASFVAVEVTSFGANLVAAGDITATFDEVAVTAFAATLTPGARTLATAFDEAAVTSFPADLTAGARTLAAGFDEVNVTGFAATLIEGGAIAASFTSVAVTSFPTTLTPGARTLAAAFDEAPVTAFPAILTAGARTLVAAFDEAAVSAFTATLHEGGGIAAFFASVTVSSFPAALGEGEVVAAAFDEVTVTGFTATLTAAEQLTAGFDAVMVSSFPAALGVGAVTIAAAFDEASVFAFDASLSEGTPPTGFGITFTVVTVATFDATLVPGAHTLAAGFSGVGVTSFPATLEVGAVGIAAAFSEAPVATFDAALFEGRHLAAGFTAVAVASFEPTLVTAKILTAAFTEVAVTGFEAVVGVTGYVGVGTITVVQLVGRGTPSVGPAVGRGRIAIEPSVGRGTPHVESRNT